MKRELPFACLIVANAAFVGWTTAAEAGGTPLPVEWTTAERIVTVVGFSYELSLRVRREPVRAFFLGPQGAINCLDLVLVLGLFAELVLISQKAHGEARQLHQFLNLRFLRLFQVLRLVGLLFRKTSFFRELRGFTKSFQNSLVALFAVLLLLTTIVYGVAVFLLGAATGTCVGYDSTAGSQYANHASHYTSSDSSAPLSDLPVCTYFGSLAASMLTLTKAVYGGLLWGDVVDALQVVGLGYQVLFVGLMIAMFLIACNILTGIVVQITNRAYTRQVEDRIGDELRTRRETTLALRDICLNIDINKTGDIHRKELMMACQDMDVDAAFASLGLRIFDVEQLFDVIDENCTGSVSVPDFIMALERLQGEARALDVILLQEQVGQIFQCVKDLHECCPMTTSARRPAPRLSPEGKGCEEASPVAVDKSLVDSLQDRRRWMPLPSRRAVSIVEQPEMRAMTLGEICDLEGLVAMGCSSDAWFHPEKQVTLSPREVDMHSIVYNYIGPRTALQGIRLVGLSKGRYEEGDIIEQAGTRAIGAVRVASEGPDVEIDILRGCFRTQRGKVCMGATDCGEPERVEVPSSVSYKEFLGGAPQKPLWFCTHFWKMFVLDFIACVREHAESRQLEEPSYWICGYALRQNSIAGDGDFKLDVIQETPFFKAMGLAEGTLLVVDEDAGVFGRIWCDFELYLNLSSATRQLDIVTVQERRAYLFSGTGLPDETPADQRKREKQFPISIFIAGMSARLEDGKSTLEEDREHILEYIGQGSEGSELEKANCRLNSLFAKAVWPKALDLGTVEDFDRNNPGTVSLPAVLRADEQRKELSLCFALMKEVDSAAIRVLVSGFPQSLQELQLSFEGCRRVNDNALRELGQGLPRGLRVLSLDFLGCEAVTDAGISYLAQDLRRLEELSKLKLHFDTCNCITSASLRALAEHLPSEVQEFHATFRGTNINANFATLDSVSALERAAFGGASGRIVSWRTLLPTWAPAITLSST